MTHGEVEGDAVDRVAVDFGDGEVFAVVVGGVEERDGFLGGDRLVGVLDDVLGFGDGGLPPASAAACSSFSMRGRLELRVVGAGSRGRSGRAFVAERLGEVLEVGGCF